MTLTKLINGERRALTPDEEREIRAQWDLDETPPTPRANDMAALERRIAQLEAALTDDGTGELDDV